MNTISRSLILCVLVAGFSTTTVFAKEGNFKLKHPRRAEVLKRANNEEDKNNQAAVNGKITDGQAKRLDRQDEHIKAEERADAKANGGFITKDQQKDLNQQENKVNRERNRMEKRDAAKAANPSAPGVPVTPVTTGSSGTTPTTN